MRKRHKLCYKQAKTAHLKYSLQKLCQTQLYLIISDLTKNEVSDIGHFVQNRTLFYSLCNASAGSIFMAFWAGMPMPMATISANTPTATRKQPKNLPDVTSINV